MKNKHIKEGIENLEKCLSLEPSNIKCLLKLGFAYSLDKDNKKSVLDAIHCFEEVF